MVDSTDWKPCGVKCYDSEGFYTGTYSGLIVSGSERYQQRVVTIKKGRNKGKTRIVLGDLIDVTVLIGQEFMEVRPDLLVF